MAAADRQQLADEATVAWHRYDLTVRFGGTGEERRFAFDQALRAERALAEYDFKRLPRDRRKAAARALSGA